MTRRAWLHLGMHKTGSTAIQHRFSGYDDGATRYLDLGDPNHSVILKLAYLDKPPRRFFTSDDPQAQAIEKRAAMERVERAVAEAAGDVILSGEEMSTFPELATRRRMVASLMAHVGEVSALAYVRDPAGFIASDFGQRLQSGLTQINLGRLYPDYVKRFGGWQRAVKGDGAGRMIYVPFDRAQFHKGELIADFAHRLGLDMGRVRTIAGVSNPSLTAEAAAVLFAFRSLDGAAPIRGAEREAQMRMVNLLYQFGRHKLAFSPQVLEPLLASKAEDILWMEKRLKVPFPPLKTSQVMFTDNASVWAYAARVGPELAGWLEERGITPDNAGGDVPAIIRALVNSFLGYRVTNVGRVWNRLAPLRYRRYSGWPLYRPVEKV